MVSRGDLLAAIAHIRAIGFLNSFATAFGWRRGLFQMRLPVLVFQISGVAYRILDMLGIGFVKGGSPPEYPAGSILLGFYVAK